MKVRSAVVAVLTVAAAAPALCRASTPERTVVDPVEALQIAGAAPT